MNVGILRSMLLVLDRMIWNALLLTHNAFVMRD